MKVSMRSQTAFWNEPKKPMSDGLIFMSLADGRVGLWAVKRTSQKIWTILFIDQTTDNPVITEDTIVTTANFNNMTEKIDELAGDVGSDAGSPVTGVEVRFYRSKADYRQAVMEYMAFGTIGKTNYEVKETEWRMYLNAKS